jgi:hypothetical protein
VGSRTISSIVALVADANYVLPLITAGGTVVAAVVAAIITGFVAAARKHKWDVQDNDLRWERERAERRRDELRTSFAVYLAARYRQDLFDAVSDGAKVELRESLRAYATAFHELCVILSDEDRAVIYRDYERFLAWNKNAVIKQREGVKFDGKSPAPGEVLDLAARLLK